MGGSGSKSHRKGGDIIFLTIEDNGHDETGIILDFDKGELVVKDIIAGSWADVTQIVQINDVILSFESYKHIKLNENDLKGIFKHRPLFLTIKRQFRRPYAASTTTATIRRESQMTIASTSKLTVRGIAASIHHTTHHNHSNNDRNSLDSSPIRKEKSQFSFEYNDVFNFENDEDDDAQELVGFKLRDFLNDYRKITGTIKDFAKQFSDSSLVSTILKEKTSRPTLFVSVDDNTSVQRLIKALESSKEIHPDEMSCIWIESLCLHSPNFQHRKRACSTIPNCLVILGDNFNLSNEQCYDVHFSSSIPLFYGGLDFNVIDESILNTSYFNKLFHHIQITEIKQEDVSIEEVKKSVVDCLKNWITDAITSTANLETEVHQINLTLGHMHRVLNEHEIAIAHYEKTLDKKETGNKVYALRLAALACYCNLVQYKQWKCKSWFQECADIFKNEPSCEIEYSNCLNNLACILIDEHNFDKAEGYVVTCLILDSKLNRPIDLCLDLENLAVIYWETKREIFAQIIGESLIQYARKVMKPESMELKRLENIWSSLL